MKVLCVAEKPSVAKSVAGILADAHRAQRSTRNSKNKYVKNYEVRGVRFDGAECDVVVTSLLGHLFEIDFPPEYRRWNAMPPDACFAAPIVKDVRE
ncbi:DNA topoisomerase, partial [Cladochytrium tenue]